MMAPRHRAATTYPTACKIQNRWSGPIAPKYATWVINVPEVELVQNAAEPWFEPSAAYCVLLWTIRFRTVWFLIIPRSPKKEDTMDNFVRREI